MPNGMPFLWIPGQRPVDLLFDLTEFHPPVEPLIVCAGIRHPGPLLTIIGNLQAPAVNGEILG
jgi:hypothetical protein